MGQTQSTVPEPAVGEKLVERLRALELRESKDEVERFNAVEDYVHVHGELRE